MYFLILFINTGGWFCTWFHENVNNKYIFNNLTTRQVLSSEYCQMLLLFKMYFNNIEYI